MLSMKLGVGLVTWEVAVADSAGLAFLRPSLLFAIGGTPARTAN